MSRWLDVSAPVGPSLPCYPGDQPFRLCWNGRLDEGDVCNLSSVEMGSHTGTHVDAPLHFIEKGASIERLSLDAFLGPCEVLEVSDERRADVAELRRRLGGRRPERLLLRTLNSRRGLMRRRRFAKDFVYLAPEGARWLVERGVRLVGIDYLSVERFGFDEPLTHRVLLGAGVPIVEGLDLAGVRAGRYELSCLPVKVAGADGAPARAALRRPA